MKIHSIFAAFAATLLLSGCFQDVHEFDLSKNVGYVSLDLDWDDPSLAGTDIHDLLVVVNNEAGAFTKHYTDARDIVREPLEVPAGENHILILANATEADGFRVSGLPQTKFTLAEIFITIAIIQVLNALATPVFNDVMMGSYHLNVAPNTQYVPAVSMREVMPTLSLLMSNIPEGVIVHMSVENMSSSVQVSAASEGPIMSNSLSLGPVELEGLTSAHSETTVTVHPTVRGAMENEMTMTVSKISQATAGKMQANMTVQTFKIYTPRIDCGKKYSIKLDCNDLSPEMHLSSYTISDWEIGFSYNGRVY